MRALALVLAVWGVGGRAWAGQTSVKALPTVQLALDFSAKPAVTNFSLQGVTHVPSLNMPQPVATALHGGQAHEFYKAVVAHQWDIPRGDDRQEALFAEGQERAAADAAFAKLSEPAVVLGKQASKPAKRTKLDYDVFGELVAQRALSTNVFQDIGAKRRILAASGYTHLYGQGGRRIPLGEADDVRIGKTFENVLSAYNNRQR